MAVATIPASQRLCISGFSKATCLTNMGSQFFLLPCPALPMAHPPQVTPGLLFRTQINFTVAIDFTASNGEWGRSGGGGLFCAMVDNSAMSQAPHTSSSFRWVTLFLGRCKQKSTPPDREPITDQRTDITNVQCEFAGFQEYGSGVTTHRLMRAISVWVTAQESWDPAQLADSLTGTSYTL